MSSFSSDLSSVRLDVHAAMISEEVAGVQKNVSFGAFAEIPPSPTHNSLPSPSRIPPPLPPSEKLGEARLQEQGDDDDGDDEEGEGEGEQEAADDDFLIQPAEKDDGERFVNLRLSLLSHKDLPPAAAALMAKTDVVLPAVPINATTWSTIKKALHERHGKIKGLKAFYQRPIVAPPPMPAAAPAPSLSAIAAAARHHGGHHHHPTPSSAHSASSSPAPVVAAATASLPELLAVNPRGDESVTLAQIIAALPANAVEAKRKHEVTWLDKTKMAEERARAEAAAAAAGASSPLKKKAAKKGGKKGSTKGATKKAAVATASPVVHAPTTTTPIKTGSAPGSSPATSGAAAAAASKAPASSDKKRSRDVLAERCYRTLSLYYEFGIDQDDPLLLVHNDRTAYSLGKGLV